MDHMGEDKDVPQVLFWSRWVWEYLPQLIKRACSKGKLPVFCAVEWAIKEDEDEEKRQSWRTKTKRAGDCGGRRQRYVSDCGDMQVSCCTMTPVRVGRMFRTTSPYAWFHGEFFFYSVHGGFEK